jgi:3-hydroxyisobutyrate dehydrogenase
LRPPRCFDGRQAQAGSKRRRYLAQLRLLRFDDPKGLQVDGVLFGEDPAASSLDRGAVVMIMATVGPAAVQRWVERLGQQHIEVVDAPVSGGVRRAAEGELLVMVGGADSAVQRVQPVLDAMAGRAPVVGPAPGDGQKVKRVNQLLCGVHIAAAAEALAYAEAMGLDAAATWQVIREGAAASFMLDDRGERMVQPSDEVKAHSTSSSTGWAS